MKVASIGETDRGGAGLSALKLHHEFLRRGLRSTFYVNRKTVDQPEILTIPNRREGRDQSFGIGCYTPWGDNIPFTTGFSCKDDKFLEEIHRQNDVVLLRWASASISDYTISRWSHKSKPLVWCLSDMAPLTGGCHYSSGCDKYQTSCYPCPRIGAAHTQLPTMVLRRRSLLWKQITIVSPSRWLADVARNSVVTKDMDIRIIRTGVELSVFKPHDRNGAKRELGVDPTKPLILFGAASIRDSRKGFRYLPELVDRLNDQLGMRDKYNVLIVGANSADLSKLRCSVTVTGHITSRPQLSRIYAAADVTLLPYIEDNLPNVCLESMACGTPVVAFAIGGLSDVIVQGINGELAAPFDVWDLAHKLMKVLNMEVSTRAIRSWAEANLDIAQQGYEYVSLFEELSQRFRENRPVVNGLGAIS